MTGSSGALAARTAPGAIAIGPDGALYAAEVSNVSYPGYSSIERIPNPAFAFSVEDAASSAPQVYASGFSQIVSLGFNNSTRDLYVLQNLDTDPVDNLTPNTAGPLSSQLVQVAPNGVRTTISGPELQGGQFLLVNQKTGDVYVLADGSGPGTEEILAYQTDLSTGAATSTVLAGNLNLASAATLPGTINFPFHAGAAPVPPVRPDSAGGYAVSKLVVFGDRLADNGNTLALDESLGQTPYLSSTLAISGWPEGVMGGEAGGALGWRVPAKRHRHALSAVPLGLCV